jgi:hypothetical protein
MEAKEKHRKENNKMETERINFGKNELAALSAEEKEYLLKLKAKVAKVASPKTISAVTWRHVYFEENPDCKNKKEISSKTVSKEEVERLQKIAHERNASNPLNVAKKASPAPEGKEFSPETGKYKNIKVQTVKVN